MGLILLICLIIFLTGEFHSKAWQDIRPTASFSRRSYRHLHDRQRNERRRLRPQVDVLRVAHHSDDFHFISLVRPAQAEAPPDRTLGTEIFAGAACPSMRQG
jgi:hypothetical protein